MDRKVDAPLKQFTESPFFLVFLITATIYAFFEPLRNSLTNKDYGALVFYLVVMSTVVLVAVYVVRLGARKAQPLVMTLFRPFHSLDRETAWPRTKDQRDLISTIKQSKGTPVILVGDSGVGKSVLVQSQIMPVLRDDGWVTTLFDNYSNFQTQIRDRVHALLQNSHVQPNGEVNGVSRESSSILVVFDQFEQFLSSNSKNTERDKRSREWFHTFLRSITRGRSLRILLVVRKEWYYDLRFLAEFVPPPIETFHLSGLRIEDSEGSIPTLRHKLSQATKNEKTPDVILGSLELDGEVSPIEAQVVGCMLENKVGSLGEISGEYYTKELGGKDPLIQEFFNTMLRASASREVSLQLLFALSIETRYRRQLTLPQIVGIIHKPQVEVLTCLTFLSDQRLIRQGEAGHYELTHDYLAERFHDLSGSELDPKQRDNILFFGDEIRKDRTVHMTTSDSRPKPFTVVSDWFMALLVVFVTARLTGPMYGVSWDWFNHLAGLQTTYFGIDTYYLPVFVSHLAWSYYVTVFYRRFFSLLKEGWVGRVLSFVTLVTCAASVILAAFVPYFWIFSIGFGGLWIGIKLYQLSTIDGLSAVSKEDFRVAGRETVFNVAFVILLGGAFGLHIQNESPSVDLARLYILVSIPTMALFTYAMYVLARMHVARKASSIWVGMFDRRPSKTRELSLRIPTSSS